MRRFLMAIALTAVLSSSALAGDIPTDGSPSPPRNGSTQTKAPTSPGEIPTSGSAVQISDATLSALLTMLGFLAV